MVGLPPPRGNHLIRLAALAVVAVIGIASCSDGADPSPLRSAPETTRAPETTGSTTTWRPPADDPTQPSPAAVAADRDFRAVPAGLLDCGVHVRTTGYPTTVPGDPTKVECIVDAAIAGTPAQFVSTARDFVGGMEGVIFRVVGPSNVLVVTYVVDPRGEVAATETTCAGLTGPNFVIPECT
ncbi:MAG: hypothetical protein R2707_08340 [Acidimicrobiales bacterium]